MSPGLESSHPRQHSPWARFGERTASASRRKTGLLQSAETGLDRGHRALHGATYHSGDPLEVDSRGASAARSTRCPTSSSSSSASGASTTTTATPTTADIHASAARSPGSLPSVATRSTGSRRPRFSSSRTRCTGPCRKRDPREHDGCPLVCRKPRARSYFSSRSDARLVQHAKYAGSHVSTPRRSARGECVTRGGASDDESVSAQGIGSPFPRRRQEDEVLWASSTRRPAACRGPFAFSFHGASRFSHALFLLAPHGRSRCNQRIPSSHRGLQEPPRLISLPGGAHPADDVENILARVLASLSHPGRDLGTRRSSTPLAPTPSSPHFSCTIPFNPCCVSSAIRPGPRRSPLPDSPALP